MAAFVALEIAALLAIPVLGYLGYRALLTDTSGSYQAVAEAGDPGYRALVDPSPVAGIVLVRNEVVTGLAVLARPSVDEPGGAILVVEPSVDPGGSDLAALSPDAALDALAADLRLDLGVGLVVDQGVWEATAGDGTWVVDNPDPVSLPDGSGTAAVGSLELGGEDLGWFAGAPLDGAPDGAIVVRQQLLWRALVADPPSGETELGEWLRVVAAGPSPVVVLPTDGTALDPEGAERLVNQYVPFPRGALPGDRQEVRVLSTTATAEIAEARDVARRLGQTGFEIAEIGIAANADDRPGVEVVVPGEDVQRMNDLLSELGDATVIVDPSDAVVTVFVGPE